MAFQYVPTLAPFWYRFDSFTSTAHQSKSSTPGVSGDERSPDTLAVGFPLFQGPQMMIYQSVRDKLQILRRMPQLQLKLQKRRATSTVDSNSASNKKTQQGPSYSSMFALAITLSSWLMAIITATLFLPGLLDGDGLSRSDPSGPDGRTN